jgi:molybdate transport repressor ModE-like protein
MTLDASLGPSRARSVLKDVTLRQLQQLAETARTGSLAGAAAAVHVTAPAVAQQLRQLERAVGMPLLERGPGGQRTTAAGHLIVRAYSRIAAELSDCEEQLRDLRSVRSGTVRLGAVSTAKYFAPHVLASFQRSHPGVAVALAVGNRSEVLQALEAYSVDLAVMGRPPRDLPVEQEVFGPHPYVIIAAVDHPLAGRRRLPFSDVAGQTFLVREPGSGTRQHLEALFDASGAEPVVGMEITSNETVKQAVMAGLGIALISVHTIAAEIQDGRLAVLDVAGLPIRRHWLVVRMARRSPSPAAVALWDFFVRDGARQLPDLTPRAGAGGQTTEE